MSKWTEFFTKIDASTFLSIIVVLLIIAIGVIAFFLYSKNEEIKGLKISLDSLTRSFDDLDEQAKLIVKTDLELNKAQEELDKRLNGLDALQKTSRLISTTLDEKEIFHRLNQPLMTALGFEKNIILMFDQDKKLHSRIRIGSSNEESNSIISHLEKDAVLDEALKEGHTLSSASSPKQIKENLSQITNVEHFVLSPILAQSGMIGFVFVGNRSGTSPVTEGDEELVSILANQIGQSLENARLFEQVFRSSQELESRIQERTKQLASALEEVQKVSKTKSEFISAVSHELRTPLTSIKGYAAILMTGKLGQIPVEVKDRLEKINKHSDNLVKMINDLLDIARIESGRAELKFTPFKLTPLIDNVRDLLTPQTREKNIQITTEVGDDLPLITMDSSQIERVLINLVGNAIKFTPPKGTITIKAHRDHDHALIEVADTGVGIKQDDLPNLFDEFYRVENEINKNVKGTGLGLSLAKKIVEAHHGTVWVKSQVNAGTSFYFTLPVDFKKPPS